MTVIAKVENGAIALPPGTQLPEGVAVQIIVPDSMAAAPTEAADGGALGWMLKFAGSIDGLPTDLADEHDHYIHGTPKHKRAE